MLALLILVPFSAEVNAGVPAGGQFELTVHLQSQASLSELDTLYWRVATPGHAEYLQFKTVHELSLLMGASDSAVAETISWLSTLNGTGISVSALRDQVTATFETLPLAHTHSWSARGLPLQHLQPRSVLFVTRRDARHPSMGSPEQARNSSSYSGFASYSISEQKKAYQMPEDLATTNPATLQMVWGPGTFGYSPAELSRFKAEQCPGLNLRKVHFDTPNHGTPGGDNFGEGSLDVRMISSFGMSASAGV